MAWTVNLRMLNFSSAHCVCLLLELCWATWRMITLRVDVVHLCLSPVNLQKHIILHLALQWEHYDWMCWSKNKRFQPNLVDVREKFWILDYSVSKKSRCNVNINTVNSLASHHVACKKMQIFIGNNLCRRNTRSCGCVVLLLLYSCIIQSNKTKSRSTKH